MTIDVSGATAGEHGTYIHQAADCSDKEGKSAGDHFNPGMHEHGLSPGATRHLGDLGNISIDRSGIGHLEITVANANLTRGDKMSFLDRGVIIHEKVDNGGQSTGNAGKRIGCGEIKVSRSGSCGGRFSRNRTTKAFLSAYCRRLAPGDEDPGGLWLTGALAHGGSQPATGRCKPVLATQAIHPRIARYIVPNKIGAEPATRVTLCPCSTSSELVSEPRLPSWRLGRRRFCARRFGHARRSLAPCSSTSAFAR